MRIAHVMAAAAALVALTATPALADRDWQPPADGRAAGTVDLQAQARANNLTADEAESLQATVDDVIARTDGTQVAINQVRWDGGDTLVPLPGEASARELGAAVDREPSYHGCHYYQFCTYQYSNFTGMVDRMSSCTWHYTPDMFVAYVNNQTEGTRARFYNYDKQFISWTQPALYEGTTSLGGRTWWIRPC